jgi:hypothetical protein
MQLDLATQPCSARGSFLSLSRPVYPKSGVPAEGPGLYLRINDGCRVIPRELLKIEALRHGQPVAVSDHADASGLTLEDGAGGRIRFAFVGEDGLVVHGSGGLGLRFFKATAPGVVGHPADPDKRWIVNCRPNLCRVGLEISEGNGYFEAPWGPDQCEHVRLDIWGDDEGPWTAAVDVFRSTWVPEARPSIDDASTAQAKAFKAFRKKLGALPERWKAADKASAHTLWSCTKPPRGDMGRESVFMSLNWMDQVWSWDNCFNAMALASGHRRLALDQLLLEADAQDEFGAYPDAINPIHPHYCYSKPPVQGFTIRWIDRRVPDYWTPARLRPVYKSVAKFTEWWLEHRRWPGETLCHYLHGNDSGWDNSTMFDEGAPLIAPDLNAFLVLQCQVLAECAGRLLKRKAQVRWQARAEELRQALLSELWKGDRFVAKRVADGHEVDSQSLVPWMPVVLGQDLPEDVLQAVVSGLAAHRTDWGVATERVDSAKYTDDGYWRGPVWAPSTMLVVEGLRACGADDLADDIAEGFCQACATNGFAENFDARTGAGLRDRTYTWTASAFRCLAL